MIVEHPPQPADLNARITVGASIIIGCAAQPIDRDRIGLELLAASGRRLADQKGQQPLHDRRAREVGRSDHRMQLRAHQLGIGVLGARRMPWWACFVAIGRYLGGLAHLRFK